MKKYIEPKVTIRKVQLSTIMVGSNPDKLNGYEEGEGLAKDNYYNFIDE